MLPKTDLLDFIFPKKCLGCGRGGAYLCDLCLAKAVLKKQSCPGCGKPAIDGMTHFKCRTKLGLDSQIGLWAYTGAMAKAILTLKYKFASEIAKELAQHAIARIEEGKLAFPRGSILTPIPLYWYRENVRGFNQSAEVGRLIARGLGWKFVPDLLVKVASTTPQASLKRRERLSNLAGSFALNPKYKIPETKYSLILFDDVWTTGATMKAAGKVLKRKGAKSVWGLTLAVTGHAFGKPVGAAV